jgi:hypothetical protein
LHWVLDVGFGEDLDRKRAGYAAQNFSVLNRIALNLSNKTRLPRQDFKTRRSRKKTQSWMGQRLSAPADGDLRCVCPDPSAHHTGPEWESVQAS